MPHQPSQSMIAGEQRRATTRASAPGGGATRADALRRLGDRMDELQRLESLEARSAGQHDRKVDLAEQIAGELRALYRGPAAAPAHPPLAVSADGRGMIW